MSTTGYSRLHASAEGTDDIPLADRSAAAQNEVRALPLSPMIAARK
jgi:hypothetical protein